MSSPDLHAPQGSAAPAGEAWPNPYGAPARPLDGPTPYRTPVHAAPGHAPPPVGYPAPWPPASGWTPEVGAGPWQTYPAPGTGGPSPFAPAGPSAPRRSNGLAVAGLALGCVAVVLLGLATGVVSAVVAALGLASSILGLRHAGRPATGGRGVAVSGVTTSAVAAVLAGSVFVVSGTAAGEEIQGELGAWFAADDWYELPLLSLRPGESATVGDYTVTVDEIQMDADAALAAEPRNDPPAGRYVQVVLTVVYEGRTYGVVEHDLLVSYVGSDDDWFYDEWGCGALTDRPVFDVGRLEPGEQATYTACIDVPVEAAQDTAVIVEDLNALEFTAEMWGVR